MKTATKVRDLHGTHGRQFLYKLSEPHADYEGETHEYVVVSTSSMMGLETYLFPSNELGDITSWCEMPGSQKGTGSHREVLNALGYEVEE